MKYMLQRSAIALACAFCIVSNANAALPDLVITSITSTSASLDIIYGIPVGGKVDAKVIVKNQGTAPSPAGKVGFYFSGNVTISASDADSGAKCDIPPLDAGASTTCSGNIPIPNLQNGEYYLGGLIDYDNVIVRVIKITTQRLLLILLQLRITRIINVFLTGQKIPLHQVSLTNL